MSKKNKKKRKTFSVDKRKEIHGKFKGRCAYCGVKIDVLWFTIDHIIPVSLYKDCTKGLNRDENLNPSCRECDLDKANLTIKEFKEKVLTLDDWSEYLNILRIKKLTKNDSIEFYCEGIVCG